MHPYYFNLKFVAKKIIRDIAVWFLSKNKYSEKSRRLQEFWKKSRHRKKNIAVVLLSGSSATEDSLESLLQFRHVFDLFVVNNYYKLDISDRLIPDFYVLSDSKLVNKKDAQHLKKMKSIKKYVMGKKTQIFAPLEREWESSLTGISHLPFNNNESLFCGVCPTEPRGYPSNTGFVSISLANASGYQAIYVIGFDYDFFKSIELGSNNNVMLRIRYNFGDELHDYSERFPTVARALNYYSSVFHFGAKLADPRIINVSEKSMIDFFSRIGFEEFLERLQDS